MCYLIFISYAHTSLWILQATDTRDALAKALYASLFEWLVEQINKSLSVGKRRTGRSISILDIYGFESFDVMNLPLTCWHHIFVVKCILMACYQYAEEQF
jgi:hypothetical protein